MSAIASKGKETEALHMVGTVTSCCARRLATLKKSLEMRGNGTHANKCYFCGTQYVEVTVPEIHSIQQKPGVLSRLIQHCDLSNNMLALLVVAGQLVKPSLRRNFCQKDLAQQ